MDDELAPPGVVPASGVAGEPVLRDSEVAPDLR